MEMLANLFSKPQAIALLGGQLLAPAIWSWQRRACALGGPISMIKAMWLIYAVTLWVAVPAMLWGLHPGFAALALSMLARAAAELPLCALKRWKVAYGLLHDGFHLILCVAVMALVPTPTLLVICGLTVVSLITEIVFVTWFAAKTGGPAAGVYFVPGGAEFRSINRRTAALFLPQLFVFSALLILCLTN